MELFLTLWKFTNNPNDIENDIEELLQHNRIINNRIEDPSYHLILLK